MHKLGISLLSIFYFGVGGLLGEFLRALFQRRVADYYHDNRGLVIAMVIGNLIGIFCLILLFRQKDKEAPMETLDRSSNLLAHGLPVTDRIALLLFSVAWVMGLVVGMVLD